MSKLRKINSKFFAAFIIVAVLLILTLQINASGNNRSNFFNTLTALVDSPPPVRKVPTLKPFITTTPITDTSKKLSDSMKVVTLDTLTVSKDSLDAPVKYSAEDSGVLIMDTKQFILYSKAKIEYKDLNLEAGVINYDQQSQTVVAYGAADTADQKLLGKSKFSQGQSVSLSDTIVYNMKTQKGLTKNTFYQEGEIYVQAQKLKKVEKDVFYAWKGRFTTCNLDTPHFAFRTRRMKLINNKLGVSGPATAEFEGVPMPIAIPFGIYPLNRGRHSGILPPTFTQSEDFGLGLEGLGYYKVLGSNADVTVRTNLYSYGGWNLNVASKYLQRYKYTGGFNIGLQKTKTLNRYGSSSKDEFTQSRTFMINWSHNRDSKAKPGTTFGANVNFGSTKYNQNILNNPYQNFNNNLTSSISYTKDWKGKYNMSVNINHNQNSVTRLMNLNLPTVNFNVVTFYPFEKKEQIGTPKWYEKIGVGYSGNLQNQISFYDSAFSIKRALDTLQWGATHNIPITVALPALGPVTISPSISFEQKWYGQKIFRSWNATRQKVDTLIKKGFYTAEQMNYGISANTRIFGTYNFKGSKGIKAIRHEIRPTLGFNYTPDLVSKTFYTTQVDKLGRTLRFSQFDGVVPGAYSGGNFGGISFGLDNLLEMKVKDKKDTASTADKKVKLIDGFGFTSSYNLLADSFALSSFNLYLRSTLFEKINITANATLDPYVIDQYGFRKNRYMLKDGKLGRITNGSIAVSTSFQSKPKDGAATGNGTTVPQDQYLTPDEQQKQLDYIRQNPAEFTDFNIPWSFNLSYSLSFTKVLRSDYSGYRTDFSSSLNFNGDFSLTPKWKLGATGYYDVKALKLQQFSMFITREMHCWQMSINVTPVGLYRSFNITVSPKSGILRDLKVNRSRTFSN